MKLHDGAEVPAAETPAAVPAATEAPAPKGKAARQGAKAAARGAKAAADKKAKGADGKAKGEASSTALTLQSSTELAAIDQLSPLHGVRGYLDAIHRIELLTPQEETELARAYRDEGDLEAARRLVLANLRFVAHIARGYEGYGLPQADLLQEGNIGLMKAVQRFNPDVGVRLISFAVHWIKSDIHEYILRNWKIMRLTTTKAQKKLFFNLRKHKQGVNSLSYDEAETIAKELDVKTQEVLEMDHRLSGNIQVALEDGDEEGGGGAIGYVADHSFDPQAQIEQDQWDQHRHRRLLESLELLDERSRDIIDRRWITGKRSTLEELAEEYGVSGERIRQIEVAAMKKIRAAMEAP